MKIKNQMMLSENHKRNLISALQVVEEMLDELLSIINSFEESVTYKTEKNLSDEEILRVRTSIQEFKNKLRSIVEKHNLPLQKKQLNKILIVTKTFARIDLRETYSKKLIGSGTFTNDEKPEEFDADISELISIINKLDSSAK
jgi:hypothetical protein